MPLMVVGVLGNDDEFANAMLSVRMGEAVVMLIMLSAVIVCIPVAFTAWESELLMVELSCARTTVVSTQ